jgi:hypothetical protein
MKYSKLLLDVLFIIGGFLSIAPCFITGEISNGLFFLLIASGWLLEIGCLIFIKKIAAKKRRNSAVCFPDEYIETSELFQRLSKKHKKHSKNKAYGIIAHI